jgi:hypothetical protein
MLNQHQVSGLSVTSVHAWFLDFARNMYSVCHVIGIGLAGGSSSRVGVDRRRVFVDLAGSGSSVRAAAGRSGTWGPSVDVTGFEIPVPAGVRVKTEIGENFPATYGLSHEEPLGSLVLNFVDNMMACSERELDR